MYNELKIKKMENNYQEIADFVAKKEISYIMGLIDNYSFYYLRSGSQGSLLFSFARQEIFTTFAFRIAEYAVCLMAFRLLLH